MKKIKSDLTIFTVFSVMAASLCFLSCTSDEFMPPEECEEVVRYEDVRSIISGSCALSGCHDGSSGVGDYRSFSGLAGVTENGSFDQEVFVSRTMPPTGFTLSQEDFDLLKCWSDNGFLEQ